ncbi:chemotaxis protein CheB [Gilvimarinus sp. F26214L]|uniref:chemotaxis protein CheB n=1 Tax=Gilvimarinus sp. DZF01 TaxID=3461371 RepID=UPI0040466EDE
MSHDSQQSDPASPRQDSDTPRLIVGVGASAGGLDAFSQLLRSLPDDTGMALVFIQHLSPSHKSIMVDLLREHTRMGVQEAADGMPVERNQVYMIPPDSIMSISDGHLHISRPQATRHGLQLPVDEFFISLADDASERAVGVILSGTGSDGTRGIKAIKEAGGLVLVESPQTASYKGMPRSASGTGLADYVLPVPELTEKLADFARQPHLIQRAQERSIVGLGEKNLQNIIEALHLRSGYDFREYKKPTLSRRIQRRMGLRNETDASSYVELLKSDDHEAFQLFKDMLIGVTAFFRDREAFLELQNMVLEPLVRSQSGSEPIRIWMPGCSTGEEAYSLAILLSEEFARQKINFNAQIFATDIDEDAVSRARAGRYSANVANEIPEEYLHRYFDEDDGGYAVKKSLRESVTFAVQNLIADPPFSKLDLVCCRNLLIYLENSMQDKLLQLFHFSLNSDGYLFLGSSESTARHAGLYTPLSKQNRIFRKNPAANQGRQITEQRTYSFNKTAAGQLSRPDTNTALSGTLFSAAETTRTALLANYAPPAVLINNNYEVLYFQGETSPYLYEVEGEPTNDVCAIAAAGLKTKIRAAVQKARRTGVKGSSLARHVRKSNDERVSLNVSAVPIRKTSSSESLYLVTFQEQEDTEREVPEVAPDDAEASLSSQLEYELFVTRQDLQSTIEQLETSNEELKASNEEIMSMNEELQSSNEELETSREELQSLNEELNTVNNQLEDKVEELESVNNDLSNLLSSTDIATIFLDTNLRIRRFTPAAHKIIHVIDSDIGRPLADLAMNFRDKDLIRDSRKVLESLSPIETQVTDGQGRFYLRRITLYRTLTNRIEGVVLTFTDITEMHETMNRLKIREKQQALVAKFGQEALTEPDLDALLDRAARWSAEAVGVDMCKILELEEEQLFLRAGVGWQDGLVRSAHLPTDQGSQGGFTLASRMPVIVDDLQSESRFQGPEFLTRHNVRSGMSVIIGPYERPWGVLGVHTDRRLTFTQEDINFIQAMANALWSAIQQKQTLDEIRQQSLAIRDREEWLRLALTSAELSSAWIDLSAGEIIHYQPRAEAGDALDLRREALDSHLRSIHAEDRALVENTWKHSIEQQQGFVIEYRVRDGDRERWVRNWGRFVDLHGSPRLAGITMDVSHEKHNEARLQAAKRAADASNQAKSAFLANMSHEIRTPLTAILGYADLLHMDLNRDGHSDSYLHKIKTNGHNLLEIINDVLDLSKVEADRIEINKQAFPIKTMLAELLSIVHLRAQEKGLTFEMQVEDAVPASVCTDMGRLKQVLTNLISNAIKFTQQGSVRLQLAVQGPRNNTSLQFKVIDTGIGIQPELLEKIFDPFEQVDSSIAKNYGGTGLGLTISRRITQLLGGSLAVDSSPEKGSTFTLDLPIGSTEDEEYVRIDTIEALTHEHTAPDVNSGQLQGVHILVVDDIDDVLTLIAQMLSRAGAKVSTAINGAEALERIEECKERGEPVDVVLMDTMMPVVDGYTAVRRLRSKGFDKPVIALTAAAMTNDRERCLQAGCNDYLSKPVTMEKLLSILNSQLSGHGRVSIEESARVLIIEDNRDAGEAVTELLEISGYECRLAASGEEGIRQAREFEPAVVLLDLTLPDMDGYEVAQRLAKLPGADQRRLIALSGQDLEGQKDKLEKAGFEAYLQKPVGATALAAYFPALAELGV